MLAVLILALMLWVGAYLPQLTATFAPPASVALVVLVKHWLGNWL
jgi:hypothetical protein